MLHTLLVLVWYLRPAGRCLHPQRPGGLDGGLAGGGVWLEQARSGGSGQGPPQPPAGDNCLVHGPPGQCDLQVTRRTSSATAWLKRNGVILFPNAGHYPALWRSSSLGLRLGWSEDGCSMMWLTCCCLSVCLPVVPVELLPGRAAAEARCAASQAGCRHQAHYPRRAEALWRWQQPGAQKQPHSQPHRRQARQQQTLTTNVSRCCCSGQWQESCRWQCAAGRLPARGPAGREEGSSRGGGGKHPWRGSKGSSRWWQWQGGRQWQGNPGGIEWE